MIERLDKYTICIDSVLVRATESQEDRLRLMTEEQLESFKKIMGIPCLSG